MLNISNLKRYRLSHNFTQQKLSELVNISKSHYQSIEYGIISPSVELAIKLSTVLDTSVEELFDMDTKKEMLV